MSGCKVTYCHPSSELYGADRMALETIGVLTQAGHDCHVVVPRSGNFTDALRVRKAEYSEVDISVLRKESMSFTGAMMLGAGSLRSLVVALRFLRRSKPDLVYVNTLTQPVWIIASAILRVPSICHVREAETAAKWWVRLGLVVPLRLASLVVANSEATKKFLQAVGLPKHRRIVVVYNGKDWSEYFTRPADPLDNEPNILVVGRLSPRKGQDVLIDSLPILIEQGITPRVVFAGDTFRGYEWYEQSLRSRIAELGLTQRCNFAGFVDDVAGLLAECQILVVPSRMEPFGTVALEGIAAERVVIASSAEGLSEIVEHNVSGILFPPGDAAELAAAIMIVCKNRSLAGQLSSNAKTNTLTKFSRSSYQKRILAAVGDVTQCR